MGPYRQGRPPPTPFEPVVCDGCLGRKLWGNVRKIVFAGQQVGKFAVYQIGRPWWTFLRMVFALFLHILPVSIPFALIVLGMAWCTSSIEEGRARRLEEERKNRRALEEEACQISCFDMGAAYTHFTRYGCFCHNEQTDERFRLTSIR